MSELEKDKYKPSIETLIALKLNFNVNLEWLLMEEYVSSDNGLFCVLLDNLESNLSQDFES